jgi:hypothetical protein
MIARGPQDIGALMEDGSVIERAARAAFVDAVRRHRQANVMMVGWENGRVVHVSPFDVKLPGEEDTKSA